MSGGGGSAPPTPDPRIGEAAVKQAELGEQYLAWSKEQFAASQALQAEANQIAKEASDFFTGMAKEDRERWETVFKPLEDEFVQQAQDYDTPERQAEAAGRARADVLSTSDAQRAAGQRQMASMGISPDSGRFAGIDRAHQLGTTLGVVGAENTARDQVRNQGIALKGAAIGLGRGLPAQAGQAMQAGVGAAGVPVATHAASTGIVQPGFTSAIGGHQGMANTLNQQYGHQLSAWDSQNRLAAGNAAGFGQFAGSVVGTGLGLILSTKEAKTNRRPVEEGEALGAVAELPIEEYDYRPGMGDGGHHVGPMAEDYAAATGRGDGRTIATQDAIGLALGAVKDLARKVDRLSQAIGLGDAGGRQFAAAA